jgi:hypothetical protein
MRRRRRRRRRRRGMRRGDRVPKRHCQLAMSMA